MLIAAGMLKFLVKEYDNSGEKEFGYRFEPFK
jgi:hypothetical protein